MNRLKYPAISGLIYILIWIIGLIMEPTSPGVSASNAQLEAFYQSHRQIHIIQAYLIDGLAGIALLVFAAACAEYVKNIHPDGQILSHIVSSSGIAAASVSLVQAGFQQVLASPLVSTGDVPVRAILLMVNNLDTFKLLALVSLSVTVSFAIFKTRKLPTWIGALGIVLGISLFLGGLSFIIDQVILRYILFLSLPLLLAWVGIISWRMYSFASPVPD